MWNKLAIQTLLGTILALAGCVHYQPKPITPEATKSRLGAPDLEQVRVSVAAIRHPLLKPVPFDPSNGLSADEVALAAVVVNPALRAARDQRRIAEAQLLQAGLLPNPQVSATTDFPVAGATAGTFNAYGFQGNWGIITELVVRNARIAAARAASEAVNLGIAWQEWQVAEAARLNLLRLLWFDRMLGLLKESRDQLKANLDLVRRAVDLGEKTAVDLTASEAAYQRVLLLEAATDQRREQARLGLNRTLGFPPEYQVPIESGPHLDSWPPAQKAQSVLAGLENRRPDLLALRRGYDSQEQRLRLAVLSQFPRINIGLAQARDTSDVITTGLAVSIDLPIFDRAQGRIALESATRERLYDEYMARVFNSRSDVVSIIENMRSTRKRIARGEEAAASLEELVDTYEKALNEGNVEILSYYQTRNELIAKRLEVLQLRQALADFAIALESATAIAIPLQYGPQGTAPRGGQ